MNNNPYLKQYQKNNIETASPEKILIMLYAGAINFLKKAKIAIQEKNSREANKNIISAENIILEFMSTLDLDIGGDLAKKLYSLYEYLYRRLVDANMKRKPEYIDEVLRHLERLKDTWVKAIAIAEKEKSEETASGLSTGNENNDDNDNDSEDVYISSHKDDNEDDDGENDDEDDDGE